MGNYSELQTRVLHRLIDAPSAVQAEVPQLINEALTKLQEDHNYRVMEAELQAYTLVATHTLLQSVGGSPITIPTSPAILFKEWRNEPWYLRYIDGAPRFMSWAASRESIWGMFTQGGAVTLDQSFPQVILEEPSSDDFNSRTISVYPLPDGASDYPDGEYRITIPYYRYLSPLVGGSDHNWITDQPSGEQYIIAWAASEGHALNWDYQKMAVHRASAEIHKKDVKNADKRFRLSSVREWVPHWKGVHSSKTRI
jgi:hypothetical protein